MEMPMTSFCQLHDDNFCADKRGRVRPTRGAVFATPRRRRRRAVVVVVGPRGRRPDARSLHSERTSVIRNSSWKGSAACCHASRAENPRHTLAATARWGARFRYLSESRVEHELGIKGSFLSDSFFFSVPFVSVSRFSMSFSCEIEKNKELIEI